MIYYSDDKLITDEELFFLNNLDDDFKLIKKFDRCYESKIITPPIIDSIISKIFNWIETATDIKLKSKEYIPEAHMHRFKVNHFFKCHSDSEIMRNKRTRYYAVGFHLNNNYKGGEFIFCDNNYVIDNTPGKVYLFNSYIRHGINPITYGERRSLIFFIDYEDLNHGVKPII